MASWFSIFAGRPAKSPELKEAESAFTELELRELQRQWNGELSHQTGQSRGSAGRGLTASHFGHLVGPTTWAALEPLLASQLLRQVADKEDGTVHLQGLIIAKARLERLGEEASLEFTYRLLDAHGDGVRHEALRAAVVSCLRLAGAAAMPASSAPPSSGAQPAGAAGVGGGHGKAAEAPGAAAGTGVQHPAAAGAPAAPDAQVEAICRGALLCAAGSTSGSAGGSAGAGGGGASGDDYKAARLTYDGYRQWCKRCPALHATLSRLLHRVGEPAAGPAASSSPMRPAAAPPPPLASPGPALVHLPALAQLGKLPASATLLQPPWVWALSSRLPPAQRAEWRLLFSSQRDGKSFNTFFGRVSAAPGPTLLLARDKAGALFGGYASQPWVKSGIFYGDVSCFIFSLEPALQIFPATGINDNFQWCGVGFSQLPSGLGWGGAAGARSAGSGLGGAGSTGVGAGGHFALYVEPSLDEGMSRPIATYGNCPLASEQVFQIHTLECWLLQPPEEEEQEAAARAAAAAGGAGGVLAKGAQDAALMELAGFNLHSRGLRDEPLEED